MSMNIIPFVGFGEIKFGQNMEAVKAILGEPEEAWEEEIIEGYSTHEFAYTDVGVQLSFSEDDDFRLGTISFMHKEFLFQGQAFIGLNEMDLMAAIAETDVDDLKLDEDFPEQNAKDYVADSIGLSCWLDEGEVTSVSLLPEHTEDGETVIWPK